MKRKPWRILVVVMALAGIALSVQPLAAHNGGNNFDDHYLAAACPEVTSIGRIGHQTVTTDFGVGVEHRNRVTGPVVFYCNIEADDYLNWLQFYAEDNSPGASVTVNLYRQDVEFGGAPQLLHTLSSTDQPGVQRAEIFFDEALEPVEFLYMYYLELIIDRETINDDVVLYFVSLRDVL